jgi:hypothetical protein
MKTAGFFKTLVRIYQITRRHTPPDRNLHIPCHENLISYNDPLREGYSKIFYTTLKMEAVDLYETLLYIFTNLHGVPSQQTEILIITTTKISSLTVRTNYFTLLSSTLKMEATGSSETLVPINLHGFTYQDTNFTFTVVRTLIITTNSSYTL